MDPHHFDGKDLAIKPLTLKEWPRFETLFQQHGPQNGCWCMYWRTRRSEWQRDFGEGNKRAFRELLERGEVPGILAYHHGTAVAWCSIAPREQFPVLERSRTLKRVDNLPAWSIVCFFVTKAYRRSGMTEALIREAIRYAGRQGAKVVEAYPLRTEITKLLPNERYMGVQSTFERIGFERAAERSARRLILRYYLLDGRARRGN